MLVKYVFFFCNVWSGKGYLEKIKYYNNIGFVKNVILIFLKIVFLRFDKVLKIVVLSW